MNRPSPLSPLAWTALILLFAACSDPKCPRDLVQQGMVCKRCPEGSEKQGNECVEIDSGIDIGVMDETDGGSVGDRITDQDANGTNSDTGPMTPDGGNGLAETGVGDASADSVPVCYEDKDGDGIGAGPAVDCNESDAGIGPHLSRLNTDCDDDDEERSPNLTDVCGDLVDNDCDGIADDESNNACEGPCTVPLAHQPGEACNNGLLGACKRTGNFRCKNMTDTECDAALVEGSPEVCGDMVDNDCDGLVDEADAIDAVTWYQDCDGDGYAPSTMGSVKSCSKPAKIGVCKSWTNIIPSQQTKTNWDCDDSRIEYSPDADYGAPPEGSSSYDLNCDGSATPASEYAQQSMTPVCVSSTISKMNSDPNYCPSGLACYAWKDGDLWTRVPPVTCPDEPYYVYYHDDLGTCIYQPVPWLYRCR